MKTIRRKLYGSRDVEAEAQSLMDHWNAFHAWLQRNGETAHLSLPHTGSPVTVDAKEVSLAVGYDPSKDV